jgi:hypothetical protein
MCEMFVSVTGGMSLVVGARCVAELGRPVCGTRPDRTIGACSKVAIAVGC